MVESWNRASAVIFYGKGGDLASNHRDEQEMSVLCLRILQAAPARAHPRCSGPTSRRTAR
jgi:TnpA family transposase